MKVIEIIVDLFYDDAQAFWLTIALLALAFVVAHFVSARWAALVLPLGITLMLILYHRRMQRT